MSKGLEAFNNYILSRLKPSDIAFLDVRNAIHQVEEELKEYEQYKAIKQEIGIDLITLLKALNKGFYIKYKGEIVHIFPDKHITINFWYNLIDVFIPPKFFIDCKKGTDYLSETIDEEYWFKDYGKTWALTKKELEK